MKKLSSSLFVGLFSLTLATAAVAQTGGYFPSRLPDGARLCFDAVSKPGGDPNPAAHPKCAGVDDGTRARIAAQARQIADLRRRMGAVEQTASDAAAEAAEANAAAEVLAARVADVEVTAAGLQAGQELLASKDAEQDQRLTRLETRADGTDQKLGALDGRVTRLERMATQLKLDAGGLLLLAPSGDSYSGFVGMPSLSLGLSQTWRLNLGLGFTATPKAPNWGSALRVALAHDLGGGYSLDIGTSTFGLGLDSRGDSLALFTGLDVGASKSWGPFEIGFRVMPVGANLGQNHPATYALGGTLFAGFTL